MTKDEIMAFVCEKIKKNGIKAIQGVHTYEGYLKVTAEKLKSLMSPKTQEAFDALKKDSEIDPFVIKP